jgi:hypothetical protein
MLKNQRGCFSGAFALAVIASLAFAPSAVGMVYFTLGGSQSRNNVPYQTYVSRAGSASIAMDLGEYFRLSYSHRQEFSNNTGYKALVTQPGYYGEYVSQTRVISNSVDFNVILFAGEIFIPYLSAGAVVKAYHSDIMTLEGREAGSFTLPPVPNLGGGVGIRLNRNFSLKLSYTVSPGVRQEPGGVQEGILDNYSQLGVTYQM